MFFSTIQVADEIREYRIVAINLNQVASVMLGSPDEGTKYITISQSEVTMADGTKYKFHQEDEENNDFLVEVFGQDWREKYYKPIPIWDELLDD